jgi:putative redox protein
LTFPPSDPVALFGDPELDHIERDVELAGALDDDQRARLLEIANKCPVHRTLRSEIDIRTRLL